LSAAAEKRGLSEIFAISVRCTGAVKRLLVFTSKPEPSGIYTTKETVQTQSLQGNPGNRAFRFACICLACSPLSIRGYSGKFANQSDSSVRVEPSSARRVIRLRPRSSTRNDWVTGKPAGCRVRVLASGSYTHCPSLFPSALFTL
jgi:hypothetical protein